MKNNPLPLVAAALLAAALAAAMAGCKPAKKAPESLLPSDPDVPPPAAVNDFTMDNLVGEFPGRIRSADYAGNPQLVLFFLPDDDSCAAALPASAQELAAVAAQPAVLADARTSPDGCAVRVLRGKVILVVEK